MLLTAKYFVIGFTILTLLADYSNKLQQDINASPTVPLSKLKQYRVAHLELCNLISKTNSSLSIILGAKTGFIAVILLILLYLFSIDKKDDTTVVATYVYFIVTEVSILLVYIIIADRVSAKVSLSLICHLQN